MRVYEKLMGVILLLRGSIAKLVIRVGEFVKPR